MKLKKLLCLALSLAVLMIGTGALAEEHNTDVTLQIFISKVEIVSQLEAMAKEYTELTGVNVEVLGAVGDDYQGTLLGKLTSDQGPTIFSCSPGESLGKFNSYMVDLSDQSYASDIAEGLALTYDGKVVGVPYGVEGYGLVYNKDVVDPSQMTDLDTFTAYAASFTEQGVDAVEMSDKSYFLIGHIMNIPFAMQEDYVDFVNKLNAGEVKMAETAEFQEWAKFMEVIRANSANPMGITYDDQVANLAIGKTAMIHQGNWVYGMFADYEIDFELGMAPLPVMGNTKLPVGMPNAWCINNQRSEEEIAEAMKFFDWLFTSERGHEYITQEFGFIPALKSVKVENLDPLSAIVHEYTVTEQILPWTYQIWPGGMINNQLFPAAQKFFADETMTGEQFLESLDAAWAEGVK